MKNIDWDKLKTFYAVGKLGNITRASEQMNLAQPAISRQIINLEERLGIHLFIRHKKGLTLTKEGELLMASVTCIYSELEKVKSEIYEADNIQGKLKVSTALGYATHYLVPRLGEFLKQHPNMRIKLKTSSVLPDLHILECDVLIHPKLPESSVYTQETLIHYQLGLYASPIYLKKWGTPTKLEDLNHHRLIVYGDDEQFYKTSNWLLVVGMPPGDMREPYLEVNTTHERFLLAEQGLGITTLPIQHPGLKHSSLVQVLPEIEMPTVEFCVIYPRKLQNNKKIRAFKKWLHTLHAEKPMDINN